MTGQSGTKEYGWGGEWGLKIFSDEKTYLIQDINFHTRFNTVDSVLFRINIYDIKNELPFKSLLRENIFVKSFKGDKWISKNLLEENLVISDDIIVTIELLRIWYSEKGGNYLFFTHGKRYEKGLSFSRRQLKYSS